MLEPLSGPCHLTPALVVSPFTAPPAPHGEPSITADTVRLSGVMPEAVQTDEAVAAGATSRGSRAALMLAVGLAGVVAAQGVSAAELPTESARLARTGQTRQTDSLLSRVDSTIVLADSTLHELPRDTGALADWSRDLEGMRGLASRILEHADAPGQQDAIPVLASRLAEEFDAFQQRLAREWPPMDAATERHSDNLDRMAARTTAAHMDLRIQASRPDASRQQQRLLGAAGDALSQASVDLTGARADLSRARDGHARLQELMSEVAELVGQLRDMPSGDAALDRTVQTLETGFDMAIRMVQKQEASFDEATRQARQATGHLREGMGRMRAASDRLQGAD